MTWAGMVTRCCSRKVNSARLSLRLLFISTFSLSAVRSLTHISLISVVASVLATVTTNSVQWQKKCACFCYGRWQSWGRCAVPMSHVWIVYCLSTTKIMHSIDLLLFLLFISLALFVCVLTYFVDVWERQQLLVVMCKSIQPTDVSIVLLLVSTSTVDCDAF